MCVCVCVCVYVCVCLLCLCGYGLTALRVSRSFSSDDQQVEIPLGVSVQGNVLIIVHHIRSLPVGKAAGVVSTASIHMHITS